MPEPPGCSSEADNLQVGVHRLQSRKERAIHCLVVRTEQVRFVNKHKVNVPEDHPLFPDGLDTGKGDRASSVLLA